MVIKVNEELCIGCGLCVHLRPNVFKMNADGKAIVIEKDGEIDNIASQCPVQAIQIA